MILSGGSVALVLGQLGWQSISSNPVTMSAWVKISTLQPDAVILTRREDEKSFVLGVNNGTPYIEIGNKRGISAQPLTPNSWAHLAVVCDAAKATLYVNGEQSAALGGSLPGMNTQITLGGDTKAGATGFVGELDELQIHKSARPPGFVQIGAFGQGGDKVAKVIVVGEHEQPTNWMSWLTTGHFGVIIKNLTFDGWVVIVVLAVMAVLSWYVMVSKTRYLNGLTAGNEVFMEHWRHVAADLTVLDDDDVEKSRTLGGRVTNAILNSVPGTSYEAELTIGGVTRRIKFFDNASQATVQ